jgi:hypothetical protein
MSRPLKLWVTGLVATSALALLATSFVFATKSAWPLGIRPTIAIPLTGNPTVDTLAGLVFWTAITLFASAMPVRMPRGSVLSVSTAPIIAVMILGGPVAAGWIAALGVTERREIRGRVPWYGALANHAMISLPAIIGASCYLAIDAQPPELLLGFVAAMIAATVFVVFNAILVAVSVGIQQGADFRTVLYGEARVYSTNLVALGPLSWLMAQIYIDIGGWATLLFALPLYTTRVMHQQVVDMRDMFTQTIGALAEAVDKRDPYTAKHSHNVKEIAVDIGREMRVSESELEALEWGGLLHDVGKIGVPDAVLLKQERLTREERILMNAHPVKGAEIIAPVTRLAPELPIIRHHHEWYNGSGYPDRLMGDEIPKLARILHVADAFEAMTAARPYRMVPLTREQAVAELRKFSGIQFDPQIVDAFVRTRWAVDVIGDSAGDEGGRGARRPTPIKPKPVPLITQAADRIAQASTPGAAAGTDAL